MLLFYCVFICYSWICDGASTTNNTFEKDVILQVRVKNKELFTLHAYPNLVPRLSQIPDGADVFLVQKPATNDKKNVVSLESSKYRGYFLTANSKNKEIKLQQMGDSVEAKEQAMFFNEYKVNTKKDIFRLINAEYDFACVTLSKPFDAYVGIDDDSKLFADSCSFYKRPASTDESDRATKGSVLTDMVEIQLASNSSGQAFGIKGKTDMKAYIGSPPDLFTLHRPGLIGLEDTVSFESSNRPNYYLQVIANDVYQKHNTETEEFKASVSFNLKGSSATLSNPNLYAISPFKNPSFSLGHMHAAPFNVRLFSNNNTAEFDREVLWKLQANGFPIPVPHFNIFPHPQLADQEERTAVDPFVHEELLKLIANPMQEKFVLNENDAENVLGRINLNLLPNPSSIWHTLVEVHLDNILRLDSWHQDYVIHNVNDHRTSSKVTEFLDWSICSATCGGGDQYRIAPCSSQHNGCTPVQEWRQCNVASCGAVTPQPSTDVCPTSCVIDCNTEICQPACCTYKVKKSYAPKVYKDLVKLKKFIRQKNILKKTLGK